MKKYIIWAVIAIAVIGLSYWGWTEYKKSEESKATDEKKNLMAQGAPAVTEAVQ